MHCATISRERYWPGCYNASDVMNTNHDTSLGCIQLSGVKRPRTCLYLVQEVPYTKITSFVLTDGGAIV